MCSRWRVSASAYRPRRRLSRRGCRSASRCYTDAPVEKVRPYEKRRNASSPPALNAMSTKRSNAQCEQFNHADPDHQHGECYRVIVEPISFLVHDTPPVPASLIGPAGRATTFLTKG